MENTPQLIDHHGHIMSLGLSEDSKKFGNIIDPKLRKSIVFKILANTLKLDIKDPETDKKYVDDLAEKINASKYVKASIVFGMDGMYDNAGNLDEQKTKVMVTNDYVRHMIEPHDRLWYAASINPKRKDAIDELEKAKEQGAKFIKFLPNTQNFAVDDKAYIPFYKKAVELNMPILSHSGYELSLSVIDQSLGNPKRFYPMLEQGVTLIGAHGLSTGLCIVERYKDTIMDLVKRFENFYMDTSAVTQPTRFRIVDFHLKNEAARKRLVFGTDYPLLLLTFPFYFKLSIMAKNKINNETNYFDKQALFQREIGLINNENINLF